MDEKLYTLKEVAEHFRVSTKTIRNWLKTGKIKARKVGRGWLFTDAQIKAVTQSSEAASEE